jgi:3-methyladenine DNA glycosylase Tag
MIDFGPILAAAEARAGGAAALRQRLPVAKSAGELRDVGDDRYLSLMSLRVFRAGLKHSLVDAKWPAFEKVFMGFAPRRVRAMSDEALEALMKDARLIRHWPKLRSVRANAAALCALAEAHGGMGAYLAGWPGERIVELWDEIAKRFSQMGGNSGPVFLRMAGKDTFILTPDVVRALERWAGFDGTLKGKAERRRVQEAFNAWASATGRPLSEISMILALSAG